MDRSWHDPRESHDALGVIVPPRLEDVFNGRKVLAGMCNKLEMLQRQLNSMANLECCAQLEMPELLDLFRRLRSGISQRAPFTLCDCKPNDDCEKCEGRKWISATQYPEVSQLEAK